MFANKLRKVARYLAVERPIDLQANAVIIAAHVSHVASYHLHEEVTVIISEVRFFHSV